MALNEVIEKRTRNGKFSIDTVTRQRIIDISIGSLHYKDDPDDTEELYKEIDSSIKPSSRPNWDYEVVKGHWHLLVRDDVTFAAVKEGNWLGFKPIDMGYLEITSKNYVRFNAKLEVTSSVMGNKIVWDGLFSNVNFTVIYDNDRLREKIEITQDARDWCVAHPPSSYGLSNADSYLVLLYECDWSGSHPAETDEGGIDWNVDWETEKPIWFRHPIKNEVLTALPASHARPQGWDGLDDSQVTLRKRFIKKNDKYYLLIGAPVLSLNALPTGSIILDSPDVDEQVGASADDIRVHWSDGTSSWTANTGVAQFIVGYSGANWQKFGGGMRFQTVAIPNGATVDTAKLTFTADSDDSANDCNSIIEGEDVDDAAQFSDLANYQGRDRTTASVS